MQLAGLLAVPVLALIGGTELRDLTVSTSEPAAQQAEARRIRVVPWLELSPDRRAMEPAVEGLEFWRNITDIVIISVDPGNTRSLKELRERVPELRYIPGIKTSPVLIPSGFDSVQGWRQIAKAAAELRDYTGSRLLLLENESAVKAYIDGKYRMNWASLKTGLRELPRDVTILWYPSAAMSGEILERYLRLCRSVESLPSVVFIDHASFFAPRFTGTPGTVACVRALRNVASKRPVPYILCPNDKYWPFSRVPEAIGLSDVDWVILYPGSRWVEAAKDLSTRLPASRPSSVFPAVTATSKPHGSRVQEKP